MGVPLIVFEYRRRSIELETGDFGNETKARRPRRIMALSRKPWDEVMEVSARTFLRCAGDTSDCER